MEVPHESVNTVEDQHAQFQRCHGEEPVRPLPIWQSPLLRDAGHFFCGCRNLHRIERAGALPIRQRILKSLPQQRRTVWQNLTDQ
jgi:hypothetical protein